MNSPLAFYRWTELDRTTYPALRDQILRYEQDHETHEPRRYPGVPTVELEAVRPRTLGSLDRVLASRRSVRRLQTDLPSRRILSRLLRFSHGVFEEGGRGPIPSSGGLQSLELFGVPLETGWLPSAVYHYDRVGHHLSRIGDSTGRSAWRERVPSMDLVEGGALLWLVVGDAARIEAKYAERGLRFLLLEAGHLMQNLCLVSSSLGLSTVPLGALFEREIAQELRLPPTDLVLYAGICGAAR